MNKDYLAIFDLDGTLFDTGEVNYFAYRDALLPYGIELDKEYYISECNGRHYTEFLPIIMGEDMYIEDVHRAKKDGYIKNLNKAMINSHLFQMIICMKEKYHISVVTTASRKNTYDILRYFDCESLFEYIVTQEDIAKVKPDPQGFLLCMEHFHMDAAHTVIFEDSNVGIEAARRTGASVLAVKSFGHAL